MLLEQLRAFVRLTVSEFAHHQGPQNAAALTFNTLLSLVPLMAVSLAVFYAFPVADRVQETIQNFLFENFVPTSGEVLQEYLQAFSDKASQLNGIGFAFLILVALMMMGTIDRSLNTIWEVRRKRRPLSKFLTYWAVLTLGPVLIGVSVVATSYLISLPFLSEAAASGVGRRLLGMTPVVASMLAFSLMYAVIPNVRVRVSHAVVGGLVAALLFEVAKRGFGYYVTTFPTYEAIYGAMATIPIFLVWVYLSWLVVLLGAEVAHCLRIFHWRSDIPRGQPLGLTDALRVLLLLDEAAGEGRALSEESLAKAQAGWREDHVETLLARMLELRWVHQTSEGKWSLARRLADLSIYEVMRRGGFSLPDGDPSIWPLPRDLVEHLRQADEQVAGALDVPLVEFRLNRAETAELIVREAALKQDSRG